MTLSEVLMSGKQADEDGSTVIMSRQACEEAAREIESLRYQLSDAQIAVQAAQSCTSHYSRLLDQSVIALRIKTEEHDCCAEDLFVLRTFVNALLHQIDIGDFVDSHSHSAKMLKPVHDLMKLLGKAEQV